MLVSELTREELLWNEFNNTRNYESRNELVLHYIFIPKMAARRISAGIFKFETYDDLLNCGILGLIDAIEKYDHCKSAKFESYAYIRVRGEIIDYLRRQDWAPISLRRKIKLVEEAYTQCENPTQQDIADYLNMDVAEVRSILEANYTFNILPLEEISFSNVADNDYMEDICIKREKETTLYCLMSELTDKERKFLKLYYIENMTMKEIGLILGITESRISQINSKILLELKNKLKILDC